MTPKPVFGAAGQAKSQSSDCTAAYVFSHNDLFDTPGTAFH